MSRAATFFPLIARYDLTEKRPTATTTILLCTMYYVVAATASNSVHSAAWKGNVSIIIVIILAQMLEPFFAHYTHSPLAHLHTRCERGEPDIVYVHRSGEGIWANCVCSPVCLFVHVQGGVWQQEQQQ